MSKWRAVYRCSICGKNIMHPISIVTVKSKKLTKRQKLIYILTRDYIVGDMPARKVICECDDGSIGLAYFQGFIKIKESYKQRA